MDWTTILDGFWRSMAWVSALFLVYGAALALGHRFNAGPATGTLRRAAFHARSAAGIFVLAAVLAFGSQWLYDEPMAPAQASLAPAATQRVETEIGPRDCDAARGITKNCTHQ